MQEQWEHRAALARIGLLRSQGKQAVLRCAKGEGLWDPSKCRVTAEGLFCSCIWCPRPVLPTLQTLQEPAQSPHPLIPPAASVPWVGRALGIRDAPWGELGGAGSERLGGPGNISHVCPKVMDGLHTDCTSSAQSVQFGPSRGFLGFKRALGNWREPPGHVTFSWGPVCSARGTVNCCAWHVGAPA